MKKTRLIVFFALGFTLASCASTSKMEKAISETMSVSTLQLMHLYEQMEAIPNRLPRTINAEGKLITATDAWWTSGFFPGSLWYLYEYTKNPSVRDAATAMTERVRNQQYTTDNHDVGFMIFCSFGNALRLTQQKELESVIVTAAHSLSTRFNPITGAIKSWDNPKWQYPVIIDNMMNLELLTQATKISGDSSFYHIAITHADTTLKYHFRPDASSYHVVSYDTLRGGFVERVTHQGYSDESSWARGQAWGFYGYVMMYRETGKPEYLRHAMNIADFLLDHPNLPEDGIPYWDFNAPNIPDELRDASAGAVIASGLVELSILTKNATAKKYRAAAEKMLLSLASPAYLARPGENGGFLLKHSVGYMARNSEVDAPLTYADYYFLEGLMRYKQHYIDKK